MNIVSPLTGNVFYKDTAQGYAMRGEYMNVNNKEGSLLATKNAVLIIKQDNDSLFVTADTLYSGKLSSLLLPAATPDPAITDTAMSVRDDSARRADTSRLKNISKNEASVNDSTMQNRSTAVQKANAATPPIARPDSSSNNTSKINPRTKAKPGTANKPVTAKKTVAPNKDSSSVIKDVTVVDTKSKNDSAELR